MCTANVRNTPIQKLICLKCPQIQSESEHAILKIFLENMPPNPPSNSMLCMLATLF